MAELFEVLSSSHSVELAGVDQLTDVQETMVIAKPSGIAFPVRVPSAGEIAGPTADLASAMAAAFNEAATADGVLGMAVTQDVDVAGNLIDVVVIVVASSNRRVTTEKTVPLATFGRSSLGAPSVGGLGVLGGGDFHFEVIAPADTSGGGGGSGGFSFSAFQSAVSSWRSDLDALAGL